MRLFFTFHIFLFFFPYSVLLGTQNFPVGSCAAAMGNAAVVNMGFWPSFHNQAALAGVESLTFGIHHENRFAVNELGLQAFGVAVPTRPGTVGFNISYFGFSLYNELKTGLSFGRYFSEFFAAGVQLNYHRTHIANYYGNTDNLTVELGFIAKPLNNLYIGAHIFNPTRTKIETFYTQALPTIFRFGIGYHFGDRAVINIETEKDLDRKAIFKGGTEIKVIDDFVIRTGISSNPLQPSFGLGYAFKNLKADLAFSYHQLLGLSPHFSISYAFR